MSSSRFRLPFLLPVAILVAGLASAQAPPAAAPAPAQAPAQAPAPAPASAAKVPRTLDIPDGALVAAGKAPELDVLYTGDVIGFIEPCG